jgi:predicted dehydrogenase
MTEHPSPPHSSPSALRVAVVGVGARSAIAEHVPNALSGASIVAAVEPSARGRVRAAVAFPGVPVFATVAELIDDAAVDAAIVTTPDNTHADIAVALLEAGIAVYLEKPLATTVAEADRVLIMAADTGTPLYVGHNFRHAGVVRRMKEIIDRGEIGEVKTIWVRHFVGNGGDYYFKDWHADRANTNTLLLQKASHDIDVVHYLAGSYTKRVVGMGDLMVYGDVSDRRERQGETMPAWFSLDNWPPAAQTGLNPVVDVEDVSMMLMTLQNGTLASYEQCHFTPDYWRNYTVIGTEGRLENVGDTAGGVVKVWNKRREWALPGDIEYPIEGVASGHDDADLATMREFLEYLVHGSPVVVTPLAARAAVAAGDLAAQSIRNGSRPFDVAPLPERVVNHFAAMQR